MLKAACPLIRVGWKLRSSFANNYNVDNVGYLPAYSISCRTFTTATTQTSNKHPVQCDNPSASVTEEKEEEWPIVPHYGFVCGCLKDTKSNQQLTLGARHFNDTHAKGAILKHMQQLPFKANRVSLIGMTAPSLINGEQNAQQPYLVATSSLKKTSTDTSDTAPPNRSQITNLVGLGVRSLQEHQVNQIWVDPCHQQDAEAASIGAHLASFAYDSLKKERQQVCKPNLRCYDSHVAKDDVAKLRRSWERGRIKAEAQNLARKLMEMPSNLLTPLKYAEIAQDVLTSFEGVTVKVRDIEWIRRERMNAFLGVAQGSREAPVFVEIDLKMPPGGGNLYSEDHGTKKPVDVALVGKGITFDSGGISIKPSAGMDAMRGDMGGAAVVLAVMYALARLAALQPGAVDDEPWTWRSQGLHVVACVPLCENMPDGAALKPGDVVLSRSGLSIQVDNTDAEGRLILADALHYATEHYRPQLTIDIATLTGAMAVALGTSCTGVFTHPLTEDVTWSADSAAHPAVLSEMQQILWRISHECGDPTWPMPVSPAQLAAVKKSVLADLNNVVVGGGAREGGACTAAAFLSNFVDRKKDWLHLDMAGVMQSDAAHPFMRKGMSGRPVRALVEFLLHLATKKQ